jgi:hypothetical protein
MQAAAEQADVNQVRQTSDTSTDFLTVRSHG